jgi:phosphoribosylformylglycinamidine synthase
MLTAADSSARQEQFVARVVVDVMLKPEILDPQGQAVADALPRLGVDTVTSVRVGRRIELEFDGTPDLAAVNELADRLLANPVIEDYTVTIGEPTATTDAAAEPTVAGPTTGETTTAPTTGETTTEAAGPAPTAEESR